MRFALVIAIILTVPDCRCCCTAGSPVIPTWIWPPIRSVSIAAPPLYGMCVNGKRPRVPSNSIVRCDAVPLLSEP